MDFHHENTWVVYGLYSGTLSLFDYNTNVNLALFRQVLEPYKHLHTLYELSDSLFESSGLFADLMIFTFESLTIILWRKLRNFKRMEILSGPLLSIQLSPTLFRVLTRPRLKYGIFRTILIKFLF